MPTWKLLLEYEGTRYAGWQEQRHTRSVQGVLRKAAEDLLKGSVDVGGAGRTDAGVHALGQVAHLRSPAKTSERALLYGLNDRLPADVNVLAVSRAGDLFHARHDAVLRVYLYQIALRRTALAKRYVWWVKDNLDTEAMREAARMLEGRHDLASFAEKQQAGTTVEVVESRLERHGDLLVYRVAARRFLWRMVRRIAGVLVEIGRGRLDRRSYQELLRTPAPARVAPFTAPPSGLFLERVVYDHKMPLGPVVPAVALQVREGITGR